MTQPQTQRRSKRFERQSKPAAFQLTDRDISLIAHVGRHRFLSSQHLAMLDGGSEQNLLRCLRVLFDHQYLDRPHAQLAHVPVTGPRPMVYGLGRRGAQVLQTHRSHRREGTDWTERNKRAGAKFIEHTLAIADFMVGIEVACRERKDIRFLSEAEIIAHAPDKTRTAREPLRLVVPGLSNKIGVSSVIADGLFGLAFPDDTAVYFLLEIDRGSMPVARSSYDRTSYNRKLMVYWEAWKKKTHVDHFGLTQVRVLTVTDSAKRVENMIQAVQGITAGKGSNFFLFSSQDDLSQTNLLESQWHSGRRQLHTLID